MENSFNYRDVQQVQSFSTPQNAARPQDQHGPRSTPYGAGRELNSYPEGTPSSDARMKTRKARITLDESDHLVIMRACVANKADMTAEGKKTVFWEIIRQALLRETGKDLALPKQVVERAMRDRHFHLEAHPEERDQPTDDEMATLTDDWMKHMESIDGADARWKIPARPVDRRKPSEKQDTPILETPILPPQNQGSSSRPTTATAKRPRDDQQPQPQSQSQPQPQQHQQQQHQQGSFTPSARETPHPVRAPAPVPVRSVEQPVSEPSTVFTQPPQPAQPQTYNSVYGTPPPAKRPRLGDSSETPQRVIVEGGMSKEDWLEVVGQVKAHDPRIPALEAKVDTLIDTTRRTHQLLIQLLKNQARRPGQSNSLGVNGNDINNLSVNGESSGIGGVGD